MIDDIYVKKINTRFPPRYVATGNYGSLVIVEEAFQKNYDVLACFIMPFKRGKITASLERSNQKYMCSVSFENAEGLDGCSLEFSSLDEGLKCMESLIVERLDEHRALIMESYPNFYEEEGQLVLFE